MKILSNPYPNPVIEHYYLGECYKCSCEFECTKREVWTALFTFTEYAKCPNCNSNVQVDEYHRIVSTSPEPTSTSACSTPASSDTPELLQMQLPLPESPSKTERS